MTDNKTSRNYVFTINNPTVAVLSFPANKCKCAVYQLEYAPTTGTPHFQGYLELINAGRIASIRRWGGDWARANLDVRRGTRLQAIEYCEEGPKRAPGTETIYWPDKETVDPTAGSTQGKRSDLTRVAALVTAGATIRDVAIQHPESYIRYYRGIRDLISTVRTPAPVADMHFLPWQQSLLNKLLLPVHPRKIFWIVDDIGNTGKSFFSTYLVKNHGAILFGAGKSDRIQHAYNGEKIALFDFPRALVSEAKDFVPYIAIEAIKNGVTQRMYGERPLIGDQPHVVCFSNFHPDLAKLSADRWEITFLTPADQHETHKLVAPPAPVVTPAPEVVEILSDFSDDEILTQWDPQPEVPSLKRKHAELEIISEDELYDDEDSDHEFTAKILRNDAREARRNKRDKKE